MAANEPKRSARDEPRPSALSKASPSIFLKRAESVRESAATDFKKTKFTLKCSLPARYLFALLGSVCFAIAYGANVVLNVTIVVMINKTAVEEQEKGKSGIILYTFMEPRDDEACPIPPGQEEDKDGPFAWDATTQGYIRSAYFYGYLVAQLPGAFLAMHYSAKWTLFAANFINIAGLVVTPVSCSSVIALIVVRVIMGLGGAVTFPAMHIMLSKWAPKSERGTIAAIVYGGTSIGTIGATLIGGYVAVSVSWDWVFYLIGILSAPWLILWAWLIDDDPASAHYISPQERIYLIAELGNRAPATGLPIKAICASLPFWAILVTHFCGNFGWYMYLTQLPSFMQQVLHKNMKQNAGMSALPFALMWVMSLSLGYILDHLRKKGYISTATMRKIATGLASVVPCACMVGICYIKCDDKAGMALIIVAITFCGGMFVGYLANHIDLSPNFAGLLMAITNTIATIPGIVMPILIGILTEGHQTLGRWSIAFYITAVLYIIMFIFYTACASGDEQPWNKISRMSSADVVPLPPPKKSSAFPETERPPPPPKKDLEDKSLTDLMDRMEE